MPDLIMIVSTLTEHQIVNAFNEWMRRYVEEPERFGREWQEVEEYRRAIAAGVEPSYGQTCTDYLLSILHEKGAQAARG